MTSKARAKAPETGKPDATPAAPPKVGKAKTKPAPDQHLTPLPEGEPPEKFSALAGEYVGLSIATGLVVGVLVGILFPRPAARRIAGKSRALVVAAGEIGATLAAEALLRAGEGRDKARETIEPLGERIAGQAHALRETAAGAVEEGSQRTREARATLARKLGGFAARILTRS